MSATGTSGVSHVGINVVGWFGEGPGMGPVAAAYADALEAAGVAVRRFDLARPDATGGAYPVTLVCATARAVAGVGMASRRRPWPGDHVIACWPWELAVADPVMAVASRFVDEVWAPSAFVAGALARAGARCRSGGPLPVQVIPYVVVASRGRGGVGGPAARAEPDSGVRSQLGMPAGRAFVSVVDLRSSFNERAVALRKNPAGFLRAYVDAFTPADGAACYLKTLHGDACPDVLAELRSIVADRPDCAVVDRPMTSSEVALVLNEASAYVSLHRGEGFGLAIAEAMAAGVPVVATGYSGSDEHVGPATAFPVPYQLAPVPAGCDPYPEGALWAEPDHEAAVATLRRVLADPGAAARRALRGQDRVTASYAPPVVAQRIVARVAHRAAGVPVRA